MALSVENFLRLDGTMEMFCEIGSSGRRFSELEEELEISHTTLSKRLAQGEEIGLIKTEPIDDESGRSHQYLPTTNAVAMMRQLQFNGVLERYEMYKESRNRFEEKVEEIREWAEENPEEFEYVDKETYDEKVNRLSPFNPDDPDAFEK